MLETNRKVAFRWSVPSPELTELVEQLSHELEDQLAQFRERMSSYENQMDEMLTSFAEALPALESISPVQFEPDWRMKLLEVAQELYRLPRHILRVEFPKGYESLETHYFDFIHQADDMGENMLEFMVAIEKHDLEDAGDLFDDLTQGLQKLETMLTTRWRKIAQLTLRI